MTDQVTPTPTPTPVPPPSTLDKIVVIIERIVVSFFRMIINLFKNHRTLAILLTVLVIMYGFSLRQHKPTKPLKVVHSPTKVVSVITPKYTKSETPKKHKASRNLSAFPGEHR